MAVSSWRPHRLSACCVRVHVCIAGTLGREETSGTAVSTAAEQHAAAERWSARSVREGGPSAKMKNVAGVVFQTQHFRTVIHSRSRDPPALLGKWFHYTVPKGDFVQNPKFKRGGVICPYNGCRQTFFFSLENRFPPMPVQQLSQLVLEEAGGERVQDRVQGTVYWQEKNDYPGGDRAWRRRQSVKNGS